MSTQPPVSKPKTWTDLFKPTVQVTPPTAQILNKPSTTTQSVQPVNLPPPPRVVPKPTTPLPSINSTSPVVPCFDSIRDRGYPLGFRSEEQFAECMNELYQAADNSGIESEGTGVRGSAATYTSSNPNKPGAYFDSRSKRSDIDAFLVSDGWLECRPDRKGFVHPDKVAEAYPKLVEWGQKWSQKLGREITPAIFRSDASAFDGPYIPY